MICEQCKREIAEQTTGKDVYNRAFIIAYNKAMLELQQDDKALSTFSLAVFDTMAQFAKNNNKSLIDFVADMMSIYGQITQVKK